MSKINTTPLSEQLHRAVIMFDRLERAMRQLDGVRSMVGKDRIECIIAAKLADDIHFHTMDKYLSIMQAINSQVALQASLMEQIANDIEKHHLAARS